VGPRKKGDVYTKSIERQHKEKRENEKDRTTQNGRELVHRGEGKHKSPRGLRLCCKIKKSDIHPGTREGEEQPGGQPCDASCFTR